MRKRFSSLLTLAVFACSWSSFVPTAEAGSFVVPTRDDVLIKTSQIQATQFLTHATFGGTEEEINSLALRMRQIGTIAAAAEWIFNQQNNFPLAGNESLYRHQPLAEQMILEDWAFVSAVNNLNAPYNLSVSTPTDHTKIQQLIPSQTRYRQFAWWHRSIANPDQLRQKTAWALSQICAVGNNFNNFNEEEPEGSSPDGTPVKGRYLGLSNYYDIFINRAFDTYRNVVQDVTYHAIMGDWLSHRGNSRAGGGLFPDENYAREVMQLFTIGLYKLAEDGEQLDLDSDGEPDPTYTQFEIGELAKVFTGLGYNSSGGTTGSTGFSGTVRFQFPMTMSNAAHETSAKNLTAVIGSTLPAITINASTNPTGFRNAANNEISAALTGLCNTSTHPPYISRLLIQRLVKSNPSKAYLNRVVQVFKTGTFTSGGRTFGSGVRGDMKAVIPAILLDPEAWLPIRTQYIRGNPNQIVVTTMGSEDSRLQEPVVNYTRYFRFFKAAARYEKGSSVDVVQNPTTLAYSLVTTWDPTPVSSQFRLVNRTADFSQGPYDSPTVFNFYVSDFQPAGDILNASPSSRIPNGALMTPEFQIVDAITANRASNAFRDLRGGSRTESNLAQGSLSADPVPVRVKSTRINTANDVTTHEIPTRTVVRFGADSTYTTGFARECAIVRGALNSTPNTSTQANTRELIEHLDLYLCGGTLNEGYRTKLINRLFERRSTGNRNPNNGAVLNAAFGTTITAANALEMVQAALTCITNAPSFLVTE